MAPEEPPSPILRMDMADSHTRTIRKLAGELDGKHVDGVSRPSREARMSLMG